MNIIDCYETIVFFFQYIIISYEYIMELACAFLSV